MKLGKPKRRILRIPEFPPAPVPNDAVKTPTPSPVTNPSPNPA